MSCGRGSREDVSASDSRMRSNPAIASPSQRDASVASVVIPAHNEAAVLGRLLHRLGVAGEGNRLQVVVACNGCTDGTAEIARAAGATVVEVDTPSKIAALNAGDRAAVAFPRLYIDADVEVSSTTIRDLIAALALPGVLCAAPRFNVRLAGCSWIVRAYYAIWTRLPHLKEGYVGSGIYALTATGRARFDAFPDVIADDKYVRDTFARAERLVVETEPFVISAPRTISALFRRRIRIDLGNLELSSHPVFRRLPGAMEQSPGAWNVIAVNPLLIPHFIVYMLVNLMARRAARRRLRGKSKGDWGRDNTTRSVSAL